MNFKPPAMPATDHLRILLVDDEAIVHDTLGPYLSDAGHSVDHAHDGANALKMIEDTDYAVALVDIQMPGLDGLSFLARAQETRPELPVVIMTGHATMEVSIQALRLGSADFLVKPVKLLELDAVLEKTARLRELAHDRARLRAAIGAIQSREDLSGRRRVMVGASAASSEVRQQIEKAVGAQCDTILITGETGTGKEVAAREIHFYASSDEAPFIAISCPAIPESLVESELFGHVKGSFTSAHEDRAGAFELADGGTLFLDEVGDLSATAQAKLLRVLETRAFRRVGGTKEINVNVRVVAATNAPLEDLVEEGKFRRDLYYRLNPFTIKLLPLRERREDIVPLAEHFLSRYGDARGLSFDGFSPDAVEGLLLYGFPGNARELRNLVERAAILAGAGVIGPEHLALPEPAAEEEGTPGTGAPPDGEGARIRAAVEEAKWNRRAAAKALGMPYSTLRYKMEKLGL